MTDAWTLTGWRARAIAQQPVYADPVAVESALDVVRALPPLVARGEVDALRARLAAAARGEAFVLQGGDCAERFADCTARPIEARLKILLQMSLVLTWGARIPVVRVGRMAGQYAKPRSKPTEIVQGVEVPAYRGDHVNGTGLHEREPDPNRLVQAYFHSAATLNYVRALLDAGFADLHNPRHWDLAFVRSPARRAEYESMLERILDAVDFLEATGVHGKDALRTVELYASHEGLLLPWEEAQTVVTPEGAYNLGAHFLWIGDRTRQLDGAHVDYFRGLRNPIGVKVGPSLPADELVDLLDRLDPEQEPGRITLITRYGSDRIGEHLPGHIEAIRRAGRLVLWSSDPMHGNTETVGNGFKTRRFERVTAELRQAFDLHDQLGTYLGGVHFELTGEDVTECVGGPEELSEDDLSRCYATGCDPRLNYAQSLELAFLLARRLERRRSAPSPAPPGA